MKSKDSAYSYLRILPAFVVDSVFKGTLLVGTILVSHFEDLSLIEYFMMKAQDFLVC